MREKKIAAAWLTYNRQDLSDFMEKQFLKKEMLPNVDLFVIDNGSVTPITAETATVLRKEENGFFSGGWNWAMEKFIALGYDYVWMMNDDIQGASCKNIESMLHVFDVRPEAMAVTPAFNSPHHPFHPSSGLNGDGREVRWIDWCCPMVKCIAWEYAKEFDEKLKGYGADLILCKTAREMGFKFYVDDLFIIHHLGSQTANSEGMVQEMCNTGEMDRLLKLHYNVDAWWELT